MVFSSRCPRVLAFEDFPVLVDLKVLGTIRDFTMIRVQYHLNSDYMFHLPDLTDINMASYNDLNTLKVKVLIGLVTEESKQNITLPSLKH